MGRLFGTDGVRGVANSELTPETALAIGRAAATVLTDGCRRRPVFVVGCDTRISSDMLAGALSAGLCSVGADVIFLGTISTPAVAYLIGLYKADAGIMISASHNPSEFNGIKVFGGNGHKLPDELEERIESLILDGKADYPAPVGDGVGKITFASEAATDYIAHLKSTVLYAPSEMRVAVDCANGSASVTAKRLFADLGVQADILFDHPNGTNINESCGSTHMEALSAYVTEHKLDCGIAFDGDADRCLFVDENGNLTDGDMLMAICSLDLKERGRLNRNTVVGTVMTNFGFGKFCEENGLRFASTKVGDRFVLEEMLLEDYSFGGEQSGHIIFRDFATTGDGQLTAVQVLSLMKRKGKKLSELSGVMTRYPQVTLNIRTTADGKIRFYTDGEITKAIESAKEQLDSHGRILVRPSGTEPLIRVMVESMDTEEMQTVADRVAAVIRDRVGQ
ncbi:MAG: phosphoglucosamine mutase [Ruminococcus sp.]|nr:phosphoglucosamine mutase [Candidatus Apopatosoma intestinale]